MFFWCTDVMSLLCFPVFVGVGVFFSLGLNPVHGYQGQAQVPHAADDAMQHSLVGSLTEGIYTGLALIAWGLLNQKATD